MRGNHLIANGALNGLHDHLFQGPEEAHDITRVHGFDAEGNRWIVDETDRGGAERRKLSVEVHLEADLPADVNFVNTHDHLHSLDEDELDLDKSVRVESQVEDRVLFQQEEGQNQRIKESKNQRIKESKNQRIKESKERKFRRSFDSRVL